MTDRPTARSFKRHLTAQRAREVLSYDPESGILRWQIDRNQIRSGDIGGYLHRTGYLRVMVDGRDYAAHCVIWLIVTGEWPEREIDHIDNDRANNRWGNLREAARVENMRNKVRYRNNRSGFKGVRLLRGRWEARIRIDGRLTYLGSFKTPEAAHAAYVTAARLHFGEFARA
jgi:hypothetical protein